MKEQNEKHILADDHIGRLLFKLSTPAIIGMFVMALYNLVDTVFVGRGVGALGIAGITIVFPIQMFVMAIAQMLGIGGASIISRALGARDPERADRTFCNVLTGVLILGVSLALLGNVFIDQLLRLFGATGTILPYARDYAQIILFGTIFFSFAMASNNIVRSEGRATIAMTTMIISAVLNMILDPIFIFGFGWGIKGAAGATVISQAVTVFYLLYYFSSGKSSLRIRWRCFRIHPQIFREVLAIGAASFIRQISGSIMVMIMNNTLSVYGGDLSIAVFGILHRLLMLVSMPLFGIAQGLQPIVGYNYGARQYHKARHVLRLANYSTSLIALVGAIVIYLVPKLFFQLFSTDAQLIQEGVSSIRIFILAVPLLGFQVVGATLFQSLGKAKEAILLTVSRQILLIVLILLLPGFFALKGIWASFPITDFIFLFVTLAMYLPQVKKLQPEMQFAELELNPRP
jgi:putative MATE family efflux protein